MAPKPCCNTLVSLEAIWMEGRGAPQPSCDIFGVSGAIPDDMLDLDSGLGSRAVPPASSESLDAVEMVP